MRCIVVDDEPLSRELIGSYIAEVSSLHLVAACKNALEALEVLKSHHIDLIFLDINMPKLSGINFYRSLTQPPKVIFTTAYPDYAVEGFELDAVDYLLKPFSFERFLKAVNKAEMTAATPAQDYVIFKVDKRAHKIAYPEIRYFEALGDYVKVHLAEGKVLIVNDTMKALEERMPSQQFLRVHKSYMVAFSAIEYLEGNLLKIGDRKIPIGETYKARLKAAFD